MAIYRGAGGSGDAVEDSASEAILTVQARDAAIAAQAAAEVAQTAAEAAKTAAELAETNAETAETNAETAETNAETAATNAAASASAASTSATNAASSASSAATSATNAANSYNSTLAIFGDAAAVAAAVTAAQTAETNAETAETNAETAATNAANSASNASTSAASASSSASSASSSASSASSSASTATTQATNASNSASAASTSATNASNSASAAATSATNAANSATAAQTAETNAETAETNAAASASSASTSASNASTSASNAATSATNASNSASSASTSATNASNSASSAATSATNAANSATLAASYTPSQTGNAGKYLKTDGTNTSWDTLDGSDINLSSPPAIGATTPSTVNATTITGQTARVNGTGQNLLLQSNSFTNAAWNTNSASVTVTGGQSDPFSGSTAFLVVASVSNTGHNLYASNSPFNGLALPFTVSIYVKASGYTLFFVSDVGAGTFACTYDLNSLTVTPRVGCTGTITAVTGATGWYRITLTTTAVQTANSRFAFVGYPVGATLNNFGATFAGDGTSGVVVYGAQVEFGSTANTYIPTTTTAVYGTPTLSFSGVSEIGLLSNGALYLQPAGTGALQAQATTSTTAGGNARGSYATDWQTLRGSAGQVASGLGSTIVGGTSNSATANGCMVGGRSNTASASDSVVSGGNANTASGAYSAIGGGNLNTAAGYFNFIGSGFTNAGTALAAVTTQSGTMNATTAVTLSGSNANIKVGQIITGTSIANDTYVAAISGTSLTLSKVASGSSTSTLSFFTPHGVVVGGGNNQATGSYSFIGGGGDAGTAANRNVASGDWSTVAGGQTNTASGLYSSAIGGRTNTASGSDAIVGGLNNLASSTGAIALSYQSTASGVVSGVFGGRYGTTRSIAGNTVFAAANAPLGGASGLSQSAVLVLAIQTTDATPTALCSNNSAAGTTNQVILPNNSAYFFRGEVISGVTGGGNTKGWTIEGVIKRGANAASTALVGTPTVTSSFADAGASTWTIAVTADTTNGGLRVTFTGQAATTIRTVCRISSVEMTY